jgi:4,5-dihydroxyphthalate decarboxylase
VTISVLPVSIACWDYDRTLPLIDGSIPIEGCAPTFALLRPEDAFARAFGAAEFDITEISLSNYTTALSKGMVAYVAIPVFLSRAFRLGTIYVRDDRGIENAAGLAGKRVGLQEFEMTAAVVVRGILRDEYGLDTDSINWVVGGVEQPTTSIHHTISSRRGDVEMIPAGRSLDALLADGELDGLISLRLPPSVAAGHPRIGRLFPHWQEAEEQYFHRTGIFPIMHAVGIRKTLLAEHPWLARSVYKAFSLAKERAVAGLKFGYPTGLPWAELEVEHSASVLGSDIWPYGVAANRKSIEALLAWSHHDGLQARRVEIDELFAPALMDS